MNRISILETHKKFHWLYYIKNRRILFLIYSGIFFWLFLSLTQPFGIYNSNISDTQLLFALMPIGIIWILINIITEFICLRFLKLSIEYKNDLAIWIIKLTFIIHVIYLLRAYLCDWICMDTFEYLQLWFAFLLMFSFCYITFMLYAKSKISEIRLANGNYKNSEEYISIDIGKEKLSIAIKNIIYFKADDNYVDIFFDNNENKLLKKSIRITLKTLQDQLNAHPEFVRIHRSYLINTSYFFSYSKGYSTLILGNSEYEVKLPVSKKYKAIVSKLFSHPNL